MWVNLLSVFGDEGCRIGSKIIERSMTPEPNKLADGLACRRVRLCWGTAMEGTVGVPAIFFGCTAAFSEGTGVVSDAPVQPPHCHRQNTNEHENVRGCFLGILKGVRPDRRDCLYHIIIRGKVQ